MSASSSSLFAPALLAASLLHGLALIGVSRLTVPIPLEPVEQVITVEIVAPETIVLSVDAPVTAPVEATPAAAATGAPATADGGAAEPAARDDAIARVEPDRDAGSAMSPVAAERADTTTYPGSTVETLGDAPVESTRAATKLVERMAGSGGTEPVADARAIVEAPVAVGEPERKPKQATDAAVTPKSKPDDRALPRKRIAATKVAAAKTKKAATVPEQQDKTGKSGRTGKKAVRAADLGADGKGVSGFIAAGNVDLSSYSAAVRARVARNKPGGLGSVGTAVVNFTVSRSGALGVARIARSSGNAKLDAAALAAVRGAAPFPAIPAASGKSQLAFSIPFSFR